MNKILTIVFAITQVLDGLLTFVGTSRLGASAEGNIVIKTLMSYVGIPLALILVKLCALVLVYFFYVQCKSKLWYPLMVGWLICFYLLVAIIPWCYVLTHT